MLRVVLDTNVIVSALIVKVGKPAQIVAYARDGKFILMLSQDILREARGIFHRKHIQKRFHPSEEGIEEFLTALRDSGTLIPVQHIENVIPNDPPDNLVLACAVEGNADYLVSGNKHFLKLKQHRNIQMVTPAQFLEILGKS